MSIPGLTSEPDAETARKAKEARLNAQTVSSAPKGLGELVVEAQVNIDNRITKSGDALTEAIVDTPSEKFSFAVKNTDMLSGGFTLETSGHNLVAEHALDETIQKGDHSAQSASLAFTHALRRVSLETNRDVSFKVENARIVGIIIK